MSDFSIAAFRIAHCDSRSHWGLTQMFLTDWYTRPGMLIYTSGEVLDQTPTIQSLNLRQAAFSRQGLGSGQGLKTQTITTGKHQANPSLQPASLHLFLLRSLSSVGHCYLNPLPMFALPSITRGEKQSHLSRRCEHTWAGLLLADLCIHQRFYHFIGVGWQEYFAFIKVDFSFSQLHSLHINKVKCLHSSKTFPTA